jgi:hypothetical protein
MKAKTAGTVLSKGLTDAEFREAIGQLVSEQQREMARLEATPYTWEMFLEAAAKSGVRDDIVAALEPRPRLSEAEFRALLEHAAAEQNKRPYDKEQFVEAAKALGIPPERAVAVFLEKAGPERAVRAASRKSERKRLLVDAVNAGGSAGIGVCLALGAIGWCLPLLMLFPVFVAGPTERVTNAVDYVTRSGGLADVVRIIAMVGVVLSLVMKGIGVLMRDEA